MFRRILRICCIPHSCNYKLLNFTVLASSLYSILYRDYKSINEYKSGVVYYTLQTDTPPKGYQYVKGLDRPPSVFTVRSAPAVCFRSRLCR